mmetsp:Transcript_39136/g.76967  ORF Transcript_39136/g.76967 Transcript_39136/m.76967 type:complete len:130 (-) Transcript_39136:89-478(-)
MTIDLESNLNEENTRLHEWMNVFILSHGFDCRWGRKQPGRKVRGVIFWPPHADWNRGEKRKEACINEERANREEAGSHYHRTVEAGSNGTVRLPEGRLLPTGYLQSWRKRPTGTSSSTPHLHTLSYEET